jgi:hypothetical protein
MQADGKFNLVVLTHVALSIALYIQQPLFNSLSSIVPLQLILTESCSNSPVYAVSILLLLTQSPTPRT